MINHHHNFNINPVLYIFEDIKLYIGKLPENTAKLMSVVDTLVVGLEKNINTYMDKSDSWVESRSVLYQGGTQWDKKVQGVCAYFLIEPMSIHSQILKGQMRKIDANLYVDLPMSETFLQAIMRLFFYKPKGKKVLQLLDELIFADHYKLMLSGIDHRVLKVIDYIRSSSPKDFDITELSDIAHLSSSRLMHLFKNETNVTLRQFHTWAKIRYALKLYAQNWKLTAAGRSAGFCDDAHFSNTFKKFIGFPPSSLFRGKYSTQIIDAS